MKTISPRATAGFSLVEVALALGIAAFCLVSVFGLLPVGVNTNRSSFEQTGAANVASTVAADLRSTALKSPPVDQTSAYYQVPIPGTPPGSSPFATLFVRQDGTLSGTINQNADPRQNPHYRVTLYFASAGTASGGTIGNPNATTVRVLITWPAAADPAASVPPSRFAGSFDTFVGLVRN